MPLSIKSALEVLVQGLFVSQCLVKAFIQGVTYIVTPVRSPVALWDPILVLAAFQRLPFELDFALSTLIHMLIEEKDSVQSVLTKIAKSYQNGDFPPLLV